MDDSINNSPELENGTTSNVAEVAEQAVPATEAVESSEPKSLRDAVVKAFEKNAGTKEPASTTPEAEPVSVQPTKEIDPITGRELEPIRAPSSMTPTLREKWSNVPREFQKFWTDRERDMQMRLQETADERKLAKQFGEVVAPYEAMFRQHGTNAVAHTKDLLNLDHQLRTGTPELKAQIIHNMITHFQPDVQTLMKLASGQPMPAPAHHAPNVQEAVRKELEAREAQRQEAEINRELQTFAADPKNEFLEDLRPTMQKAIEAGFVTGNNITELFRNAYDFAAKQHPEVSQVLASRAAAQNPVRAATPTAKPIQSLKPSLASGGRGGQVQPRPKSLREAAEMAWNKHSGS